MSTEDFDLRTNVRKVIEESSLRGPQEIAAKVAENVPQKYLRKALATSLVEFVRQELQKARRPLSPVSRPRSNPSAKVAAIREGWRKTLAGQFHVGSGRWEVLANCGYDEVMFLAGERFEHARRTNAAGQMFEELAEAIQAHGVGRAGDLPEQVLADILSREAAAA